MMPQGLWKFWFQPGSWVEYYPIGETVLWFQHQLWHDDTLGYHLLNVFLHIIDALLVWRLLSKFGLRLAWLGGLIFAIHPVQVESVAWMVEIKKHLITCALPPGHVRLDRLRESQSGHSGITGWPWPYSSSPCFARSAWRHFPSSSCSTPGGKETGLAGMISRPARPSLPFRWYSA